MDKDTKEFLRTVVETYANTPVKPIENLKKIHSIILETQKPDAITARIIKSSGQSCCGISCLISLYEIAPTLLKDFEHETFGKVFNIIKMAFDDASQTCDCTESEKKQIYTKTYHFLDCYFSCPCTLERAALLVQRGFMSSFEFVPISPDDSGRKKIAAEWTEGKGIGCLSCVECDQLHFVAIMESLSKGEYRHMDSIVKDYSKSIIEYAKYNPQKNSLEKMPSLLEYSAHGNFPYYLLNGLPSSALVDLLLSDPKEIDRIKQCPYCNRFFFAKDTKRMYCYEYSCVKEYRRLSKKRQREEDPVIYV